MESGTALAIHSVPGHISVEENEKEDEEAKDVAENADTGRCRAGLVRPCRSHDHRVKVEGSQTLFRMESKSHFMLQSAWYNSALECQGSDTAVMRKTVRVSRWYFQHKSGHAVMGRYLNRIGLAQTN